MSHIRINVNSANNHPFTELKTKKIFIDLSCYIQPGILDPEQQIQQQQQQLQPQQQENEQIKEEKQQQENLETSDNRFIETSYYFSNYDEQFEKAADLIKRNQFLKKHKHESDNELLVLQAKSLDFPYRLKTESETWGMFGKRSEGSINTKVAPKSFLLNKPNSQSNLKPNKQ